MSLSPNLLNLALWTGGILLSLAGIAWLLWSLFSDRPRGRRRCPSCWYDFAGLATNSRCPECGRGDLTERHLSRTRRRWGLACLAIIPLIAGYITWATPRVFEENSATGFFPTTFLVLAAPTLDAKAIDDGSNLRGLTFARLNRGEIKRPWRWLWRQRVKLAHTLTGTPYIEVAWEDVKSIYPPPEPVPEPMYYESPINLYGPDPEPSIETFGEALMLASGLTTDYRPPSPQGLCVAIGEHWIFTGEAPDIDRARRLVELLKRSQSEPESSVKPHRRRFDHRDSSRDMAIVARLESSFIPAWEGTITLPQLADKISLAANCPIDLDLEPSTLTEYETSLDALAHPNASVRVTLGALCTATDTSMTWTVRDGRIILRRRPASFRDSHWIPPDFVDPSLVLFDVSDLVADESEVLGRFALRSDKQAQLTDWIAWNIDQDAWIPNAGYHTLGVVGDFMAVEADPPTIHLIGLLLDFVSQTHPGLGTDRQRVLTWGELPRDRQSLCGAEATLSGTRANPQVVAYNLNLMLGEDVSRIESSDEAHRVYWSRHDALHEDGGLEDRLWKLESCPDAKPPRLNTALISTSTLLVIAPAPTQAKVAQLLREFEARRRAQPAATAAPPAK